MRQNIVAGNWKMNKTFFETNELIQHIVDSLRAGPPGSTIVIISPPFVYLENAVSKIGDLEGVYIASQNCHHESFGAYTGEVSAKMLRSVGVDYSILGHSERRAYFNETNELLAKKIDASLAAGLKPIYCCGEVIGERQDGQHFTVVQTQIEEGLFHLDEKLFSQVAIAYEPVWAIGTGETATPAQAQEMHAFIRGVIVEKYGKDIAEGISLLYGGSCKPTNAQELFAQPDIDGGLIGGASLDASDFLNIIDSF